MEIITPGIGLILWSILSILNLVLCVAAIIKLAKSKSMECGKKMIWILAIIMVPFVGALTYLEFSKKNQLHVA